MAVLQVSGVARTLHDTGEEYLITPTMDGGVYGTAISDCVCKGIGGSDGEFKVTWSTNSTTLSFQPGSQAVIGGAFFRMMDTAVLELNLNTKYNICARVDLSKASGQTGIIIALPASQSLKKDNLNSGNTTAVRDLLLYEVETSNNGVSSVTDKRVIKGDGGAGIANLDFDNLQIMSQGAFPVLTTAPSSAYTGGGRKLVYLTSDPATKYNGYIYFIKES